MTKRLTAISLFSGCGGLDLGFEKKGFDIIWALDHDYFSCETYRKNFGNKILNRDMLDLYIKGDVFSLGLTILQCLTCKNILGFNR